MHKVTKIVLVALGVVLVAIAAAVAWVASIDFNDYKDIIAAEVEAATGRKLKIEGDLKVRVSLAPAVRATGVSISNPAWAKRPDLARIESLDAQVEILPLLTGDVRFKRLVLDGVEAALEKDASGRGNWEIRRAATGKTDDKSEADDGDDVMAALRAISRFRIRDATILVAGADGAVDRRIGIDRLEAVRRSEALVVHARGNLSGTPYDVDVTLGPIDRQPDGADASLPIELSARMLSGVLTAQGVLRRGKSGIGLDGTVTAGGDEASDTVRGIRALLSSGAVRSDEKAGPYRISARTRYASGRLDLTEIAIKIGTGSALSGRASVIVGNPTPRIDAALSARAVDIDGLLLLFRSEAAVAATAAPTGDDKRVFSAVPLPFSVLRSVAGKVRLDVGRVLVSDAPKIEQAAAVITMDGGRVALQSFSARLAGGSAEGSARIDASGAVPSVSLSLTARDVVLGDLVKPVDDSRLLSGGKTDAEIRLTSSGETARALVAALSGTVSARVGKGRIDNKLLDIAAGDIAGELVAAINPLKKKERYSRLRCGVARAWFGDGRAHIPASIAFETEKVSVMASGGADLKQERLDIALRPEASKGLGIGLGGTAAQFVRVRGTFKEPRIGIDELGAAKTVAKVGAAVATTGLSILAEKLIEKATESGTPCQAALAEKLEAPPKTLAEGAQKTVEKSAEGVGKAVEGAGKGVVKGAKKIGAGIGDGLRSLFKKSK